MAQTLASASTPTPARSRRGLSRRPKAATWSVVNRDGTPFATAFNITRVSGATVDTDDRHHGGGDHRRRRPASATLVIISQGIATSVTYAPGSGARPRRRSPPASPRRSTPRARSADFTATSDGAQVVIVNRAGNAFTVGNFAPPTRRTATTAKVTFGGAVRAGEKLEAERRRQTLESRVAATGTLAAMASALRGLRRRQREPDGLHDDRRGRHAAHRQAHAPAASPPAPRSLPAGSATTTPAPARCAAYTLTLAGTPASGETWSRHGRRGAARTA